jgi:hypothetical protein
LSRQGSSFDICSSTELVLIGLILITAGGLAYAILNAVLSPLSAFLVVLGVMIFLQSSWSFRAFNGLRFIVLLGIASGLILVVDWWPLQLFFAGIVSDILFLLQVPSLVFLNPHFGGLQVLLFAPAAGTGGLAGGEIDNACAGLHVLVPAFLLLWTGKPAVPPTPNRLGISVIVVSVVILGDLARIVVELWVPAVGLAPFALIHYPGAYLLGLTGLIAIALAGERWKAPRLH